MLTISTTPPSHVIKCPCAARRGGMARPRECQGNLQGLKSSADSSRCKRSLTSTYCKRSLTGAAMIIRTPAELGTLIRNRRQKLGLSQASLSETIGVSRLWLNEIEKGKPRAEIGLVLRTLDALGITVPGRLSPNPSYYGQVHARSRRHGSERIQARRSHSSHH